MKLCNLSSKQTTQNSQRTFTFCTPAAFRGLFRRNLTQFDSIRSLLINEERCKMGRKFNNKFSGVGGGMGDMMKQAQKMQADMEAMQAELDERTETVTAGGGAITVTVSGKKEIKEITISPEVVDPDDVEMLQDLVVAAVNEALRKIEEITSGEMAKITGGFNLPGF